MINNIQVTNQLGESITLEMRFPEKSGFLIRNIEGLTPPKADINTTDILAYDGTIFNSSRVDKRNIVFDLAFLWKNTIEEVRRLSYKYFPIKKQITIRIETDSLVCSTIGYVESNEINIFSKEEGCNISVICPSSYFYSDLITVVFSSITPLFEFPFSNESTTLPLLEMGDLQVQTIKDIYYEGDADVGIVLNIHALGTVTNPSVVNSETGETIAIDSTLVEAITGSGIVNGDDIVISTVKGDKYAVLRRSGVEYNIINALGKYPDWFELRKGDNIFAYLADAGSSFMQFKVEYRNAYEGI